MKAKELRVDNWIHLDSMTDGTSVDLECGLFHMEEMGRSFKYKYSPIPLTEEWLVKFGFENIDTNENGGDNYWYLSKGDFMLDRSFQSLQMNTGFDLEHVHQLQNLYFALTGEEL